MAEHTPGPWAYHGPADNIHVCEARDPNMRICFLTSDGPAEANARLIALAPAMLEALKRIAGWCPATQEMTLAHEMAEEAERAISFISQQSPQDSSGGNQ